MSSRRAEQTKQSKPVEKNAGMAELADAQASGACGRKIVWVQVPFPAFFFILSKIKKTEAPNTGTSVFLFIFLFQKRSRSRPREAHL